MLQRLAVLQENAVLSEMDLHFSRFIARLAQSEDDNIPLSAALTSYMVAQGHVCLDLKQFAGQLFPANPETELPETARLQLPALNTWLHSLQHSRVVGQKGDYKPFILEETRLYLYRYWDYEQLLARQIHQRLTETDSLEQELNQETLRLGLHDLFHNSTLPAGETDWQRTVALQAVSNRFCIISGGPGTGKTTTVVKILALLLAQKTDLQIALVAPTGKAAARLQEAITQNKHRLSCSVEIKAKIPQETSTIHRLLGSIPNSPYFQRNAQNPLPYDVIVVDEASMVDLALMAKLVQAIQPHARLILLGDKDQLASVEAGTVLGDLCAVLDNPPSHPILNKLSENIVLLRKSYRFDDNSGIGKVAHAVKTGNAQGALNALKTADSNVQWFSLPINTRLQTALREQVIAGFSHYLSLINQRSQDPQKILQAFDEFRILCALRKGMYGVEAVNRVIEQILKAEGLIKSYYPWYVGRPILITQNDYTTHLYNGDIGIVLWSQESRNELQAYFPATDGGEPRAFWLNRLPEHETVYAMTIHKSQGSEFDNVLLLLPEQESPILTRELLYTGITRAKKTVSIWGKEPVFTKAVQARILRNSGLGEGLMSAHTG
ncbi:exodeoxyribonuclease V, alpha subunit [Beggiatoa alba B18LD]|uniref:RecBCD enzyme subunit RecD n=1 Tax=Beggiatoa alba B18LD TaxID=395493 RepID=I3CII0_9GAMM|nr:exodeoxyribonuclease V subunit alpha [Beggiatoa alba]EIJ43423.1 exodeoxyribonuclease V, alpha subunit [Beggiatoa alba B18LD]